MNRHVNSTLVALSLILGLVLTFPNSADAAEETHAPEADHEHEKSAEKNHEEAHDHDHANDKDKDKASDPHKHEAETHNDHEHGKEDGKHEEDEHEHEHGHDHDEGHAVKLNAQQLGALSIPIQTAQAGSLATQIKVSGQIVVNADRLAHVVPQVPGVASEIFKSQGDVVNAGQIMAILDSRELAEVKRRYLVAAERVTMAKSTFVREETLWKKKISAEQDYLQAKQVLAEAQIEQRSAEQELHTLGFPHEKLKSLSSNPDVSLTRYEMLAPFEGTLLERHISRGEAVKTDEAAFVLADLRTVWVELNVAVKDIASIARGQSVGVSAGQGLPDARGEIIFVEPVVNQETRTARARVLLANPDGHWRPGVFVTAYVAVSEEPVALLLPRSAIQTVENKPTVFVQTDDGFEPRPVQLGRSNNNQVEIIGGLKPGERYAADSSFTLKAELGKSEADHDHSH